MPLINGRSRTPPSTHGLQFLLDFLATQEWTDVPQQFRELRFDHNVRSAASEGHPAVLEWWMTKYMPERAASAHSIVFKIACGSHRVNVLKWLHKTGKMERDFLHKKFEFICKSLDLARWLHQYTIGVAMKLSVAHCASVDDNIEFIKWAHAHEDQYMISGIVHAMDECAMLGRLDDLIWLHANRSERCSSRVLSQAVLSGQVNIVEWLLKNNARGDLNDPARGSSDLI